MLWLDFSNKGPEVRMPTAREEYAAAQKALRAEEQKMEAGKPHNYRVAYERFCDATRALNAENEK